MDDNCQATAVFHNFCVSSSVRITLRASLTGGTLPPAKFSLETLQTIPRTSAVAVPVHCFQYSGQTNTYIQSRLFPYICKLKGRQKVTSLNCIVACTSLSQFLSIDFPTANRNKKQTRSTTNAKATQGLVYMSNIYISILKQTGVIKN